MVITVHGIPPRDSTMIFSTCPDSMYCMYVHIVSVKPHTNKICYVRASYQILQDVHCSSNRRGVFVVSFTIVE